MSEDEYIQQLKKLYDLYVEVAPKIMEMWNISVDIKLQELAVYLNDFDLNVEGKLPMSYLNTLK